MFLWKGHQYKEKIRALSRKVSDEEMTLMITVRSDKSSSGYGNNLSK